MDDTQNLNEDAMGDGIINEDAMDDGTGPAEAADDKTRLVVGGFVFASPEDAGLARDELKKIEYLNHKMNYQQPENILAVYNKVLENKLLKTPPGYEYMRRIQEVMLKGGIAPERIAPIHIHHSFTPKTPGEITEGIARQRIERQLKKEKSETDKYRARYRGGIIVCLFLAALVVAMFIITVNSDNPNILNYEKSIIDKYASWEQELKEREQKIRDREKELP